MVSGSLSNEGKGSWSDGLLPDPSVGAEEAGMLGWNPGSDDPLHACKHTHILYTLTRARAHHTQRKHKQISPISEKMKQSFTLAP